MPAKCWLPYRLGIKVGTDSYYHWCLSFMRPKYSIPNSDSGLYGVPKALVHYLVDRYAVFTSPTHLQSTTQLPSSLLYSYDQKSTSIFAKSCYFTGNRMNPSRSQNGNESARSRLAAVLSLFLGFGTWATSPVESRTAGH